MTIDIATRIRLLAAPRRGSLPRTLLEAALGCALLFLLARTIEIGGGFKADVAANVPEFIGLLWLVGWTAWRLQPVGGDGGALRIGTGIARSVLSGVVLGVVAACLSILIAPVAIRWTQLPGVLFGYLLLRGLVVLGAALLRPAQRRLRWQLLWSYAMVIALMLVMLAFIGSLIGFAALDFGATPKPVPMASSVADELQLAHVVAPFKRQRTDQIFRQIFAGRLPVRGEPPLAVFNRPAFLPLAIAVVDRDGHVRDGRVPAGSDGRKTSRITSWQRLAGLGSQQQQQLRQLALAGHTGYLDVSSTSGPGTQDRVAEAPVRGPNGAIDGMVVLRVAEFRPSATQFAHLMLAAFGVTTTGLLFVTFIPMIGLSFLFSYFVARGLTRRLESLSRVATSIASGNLSERAPVTSENEVGRLAGDINRMADHLETSMAELRQARARAEEALRVRQELVANISHELRTPLATARAHLETVTMQGSIPVGSGGRGNEDIHVPEGTLAALQGEMERLEALVDDLFALSRAQAGAVEVQAEPVDVGALVEEVAATLRPLAQREGSIALSAEVQGGPIRGLADPGRLHQILSNLVRNAVRHTPDGGIIVIAANVEAPWVSISVADTGEGIPPEHLPHVFERFYRADPARSRATGGAGLGLAIVREFVELMGGRVEVQSVVGEGTRFTVFLPLA